MIYPVDSVIHLLNNWGQAPVVQKLDSAIHRINHYPDKSSVEQTSSLQLIIESVINFTGKLPMKSMADYKATTNTF